MAEPVPGPLVSVIIPVRNSPHYLRQCLASLGTSRYTNFEVLVVDDGSTDVTPLLAAELGARVVRLQRRAGPAAARNRGAEEARGQYLLFLDADVCVHPDTVGAFVDAFAADPAVAAVFGSYDRTPRAPNLLSQYKNLLHHFVHQTGCERASTFWSGCGAIKRSVFLAVGGYDSEYDRPCVEDIELGIRLRKAGHPVRLHKHIQATHLKHWTLWGILKTDVWDRGVPWTQLLLRERSVPNDLNLKRSQRVSTLFTAGFLATFVAGLWALPVLALWPACAFVALLVADRWSLRQRIPRGWACGAALLFLVVAGGAGYHFGTPALAAGGFLLGIFLLNLRLYAFFARVRHPGFAALAFPLQLLYYLYSGLAFAVGAGLYLVKAKPTPFFTADKVREPAAVP
jgi:hypothetical protein